MEKFIDLSDEQLEAIGIYASLFPDENSLAEKLPGILGGLNSMAAELANDEIPGHRDFNEEETKQWDRLVEILSPAKKEDDSSDKGSGEGSGEGA